jgi:hypothetical protein
MTQIFMKTKVIVGSKIELEAQNRRAKSALAVRLLVGTGSSGECIPYRNLRSLVPLLHRSLQCLICRPQTAYLSFGMLLGLALPFSF